MNRGKSISYVLPMPHAGIADWKNVPLAKMFYKIMRLRTIAIFLSLIFLTSCHPSKLPKEKYEVANDAYGETVTMDVCLDPNDNGRVHRAMEDAWKGVGKVRPQIDIWDSNSDAFKINHSYGRPVQVSPETYALIKEAVGYSALTKNTFDITVQPLLQLWKDAAKAGHPPSQEQIDEARKAVGVRFISFLPDNKIELLNPQTRIDLGGLGANMAVENAANAFRKYKYRDFMIAAAGDMYMSGHDCNGQPWRVGILNPLDKTKLAGVVSVVDMAVSTSGDYERYSVIQGKKYSHDMNPLTGYPQTGTTSGTSIAPGIKEAGALAKALIILSPEEATQLTDKMGFPYASFVIYKPTEDSLQFYPSRYYSRYTHISIWTLLLRWIHGDF